jgi:hypothetical protein
MASPPQSSDDLPVVRGAGSEGLSKGLKEIRMESGVGLFEAFELATSDTHDRSVPFSFSNETRGSGSSPATSDPRLVSDSQVAQASMLRHEEWDEPPMEHVSAVPLVMAALFIAATGKMELDNTWRERERHDPFSGNSLRTSKPR